MKKYVKCRNGKSCGNVTDQYLVFLHDFYGVIQYFGVIIGGVFSMAFLPQVSPYGVF